MSRIPFIIAVIAAVGALGYFVFVTDATAHMGSDPETCANCHNMDSQYEDFYHGAHKGVAVCVDCHLPHGNFAVYYAEKGRQGAKDVFAFVSGNIPEKIRATDQTRGIIQANCVHCHESAAETVVMGAQPFDRYCWDCHRNIMHQARGASSNPFQDSTLYPTK
jgi:cytochrome c nitrite reductase small subunit